MWAWLTSRRSSPVSIFLRRLKDVASIFVYLTGTGYPTDFAKENAGASEKSVGEKIKFIESKIESAGLTEEHFAPTTVRSEHFCNSPKIGILLWRAEFTTTRRLASCHPHKWSEMEVEDPDVWMAIIQYPKYRNEVACKQLSLSTFRFFFEFLVFNWNVPPPASQLVLSLIKIFCVENNRLSNI